MIHNKELSEKNFKLICEQLSGYYDVSYGNDTCDSVYNEERDIIIFLPNSLTTNDFDNELFNSFYVIINDQEINGERIESDLLYSVDEIVKFINDNAK